jgi:hypothetical protein
MPNYSGYPLVIINSKVSREDKIEFIKQTYKQKDVHKYTNFLRASITDLNDMDDFIEATIIQNNRVSEKGNNIQDLFQRIFIGMRGDYYNLEENISNFKNAESFFKKYSKYVRPSWIGELTSTKNWRQSRNSTKFSVFMVSFLDFEEQIKYAEESRELGSELFSKERVQSIFEKQIVGNEQKEKVFLPYILSRDEDLILKIPSVHTYINKYSSEFEKFLVKFNLGINEEKRYYYGRDHEEELEIINRKIDILENLSLENLNKTKVISDEVVRNFGFYCKDKSQYNSTRIMVSNFNSLVNVVMGDRMVKLIKTSKGIREMILKSLKPTFEDSSFINGEILSQMSEFLKDNEFVNRVEDFLKVKGELNCARAIVDRPISFFEKAYPEETEIIENLKKLKNSLNILLSI